MNKLKPVLFFTEAGADIGFGHLMECLSLAEILSRRYGGSIFFYIRGNTKAIEQVKRRQFPFQEIPDFGSIDQVITGGEAGIGVCNLRSISPELQISLNRKKIKTVVIDELGNKEIYADVLINGSPVPIWHQYDYPEEKPKLFLGPKFMVMDRSFAEFHTKAKKNDNQNVLVSMGGIDKNGATTLLAGALEPLKDILKTIIIGPGFVHVDKLDRIRKRFDSSFHIISNAGNMAELIFNSDLVFSTGGNTLYEAVCLGTPAIVLWEEEHEAIQTEWFEQAGAAVNLGQNIGADKKEIRFAVEQLLRDIEKRKSMSRKGKALLDGRGGERIARIIDTLYRESCE